jgi:hypothetical protein
MDTDTPLNQPRLTRAQKKRIYDTNYVHIRYQTDAEFRKSEIERTANYVKSRYQSDPVYRQRMIDNAKQRYYTRKAAAQ